MNFNWHRVCRASTGVSQRGTCKVVSSKACGSSPGAKHSCSNLSGCHRPSAVCSDAVRAKLSVKSRSSVHRCWVPRTKYHRRNAAGSVLNEPCVQALLLAGALDSKAGSSTGQRQWNSLQCGPVHGSGRVLLPKKTPPLHTRQGAHQQAPNKPNPNRQKPKTEKEPETRGGGEAAKDHSNWEHPKSQKQIQNEATDRSTKSSVSFCCFVWFGSCFACGFFVFGFAFSFVLTRLRTEWSVPHFRTPKRDTVYAYA